MTWVFGSPTTLGSSVCLADIQVTFGDRTIDCLRKLYPIERNLMAGFAGNVEAGFQALWQLQQVAQGDGRSPEAPADIDFVVDRFPAVIKTLFDGLSAEVQSNGLQVVIGAAESADRTVYGSRARVVKFEGPDFVAQEIAHKRWTSIGSGAGVAAYQAELEKVTGDEANALLQMEVGGPGGHAQMMGRMVALSVWDLPQIPGISRHFHIGVAFANELWIASSDREDFPVEGPPHQIRMPKVANSWDELWAIAAEHGISRPELSRAVA